MSKMKRMLGSRVALALGAWAVYVLAFIPLYRLVGPPTTALVGLPVVVTAWLFGMSAGLLAGLLAFPLSALLVALAGEAGWDVVIRGVPGFGLLVFIGIAIGRLRDLGERAKWELTERKRVEEELRKHRDHLEELVGERIAELRRTNEELQEEITERKRMEEALRGSEQRLSTTLRSIGDAVIATDAQGIVTLMNPVAEDLTGWDEAEAVGKSLEDVFNIINEQTGERAENPVARVIREGVVVGLANHTVLIAKDGTKRPIADSGAPMRDEEGNIIGTVMVFRDITERRRAEEALRVSEERFALAVRGSDAGLWDWDIQNNSLYWSPRLKELLGYADDELDVDFDTFESLLHPDDREHTGAAIEAHLRDRGLYDVEQRLRTKSGEYRWFRARGQALWDEAGNPVRMIGFTTDVTERKRAEEALRESEERFRSYFKLGLIGMAVASPEREWLEVNDRLSEILGYSRDGLLSMTWDQLTYPEDVALNVAQIERVLAGEIDAFSLEKRFIRKDGEIIRANISTRCIRRPDGSVDYFVTLIQDITERKRAEEALQEYSERLEEMVEERTRELRDAQEQLVRREKLAILGQLAGGVGHELRNPLGVISNAVYYLKMVLTDADETTKEFLDIISEEVRNSTKIISDLLDFSRTRMPDREEAAVSELAAVVLKKRPPPENVEATTEIAPDLPPVFVDPQQMVQVLGNLVTNAYQAMKKEGGKLTISAQAEEGQVTLSIADTGVGIPPENMAKLFEPLFTTKARGIGLGLAVSKSLVEANGGSMEVESEEGMGSTFTVRLPIREEVA